MNPHMYIVRFDSKTKKWDWLEDSQFYFKGSEHYTFSEAAEIVARRNRPCGRWM